MKKYLTGLFIFLAQSLEIFSQASKKDIPVYYSHILEIKIISIDTILLVKERYISNSAMPVSNFQAALIKVRIKKIYKGRDKNIPTMVMIELNENEHNCPFNFEKDKEYKLFAFVSEYFSKSIKKKYKKKYLRLDCYNPPQQQ